MTQQLLPFLDRWREICACDVVWGYFPLTGILQIQREEDMCRVDPSILGWRNKLQPQYLKDLRVLHNFKEVDSRYVESPTSFPRTFMLSVIRTGWSSGGIMNMIGKAIQAQRYGGRRHDEICFSEGPNLFVPFSLKGSKVNIYVEYRGVSLMTPLWTKR